MGRVRSPKRRVRDDDFIVGYPRISSDYPRIVFILAEAIQGVSPEILNLNFRGRRNIWWCWRVTLVAPRVGMDVSYVKRMLFSWQAQYLHGEVSVSRFVAGAALRDILIDSRSAKCCICQYKMRLQDGTSKVSEAAGARWRFYRRISSDILGLSPNRLYIGGSNSGSFPWNLELEFSWQAQYLVMLEGDSCCSARWNGRFICQENAFFVAGTIFAWRSFSVTFRGRRSTSWYFDR